MIFLFFWFFFRCLLSVSFVAQQESSVCYSYLYLPRTLTFPKMLSCQVISFLSCYLDFFFLWLIIIRFHWCCFTGSASSMLSNQEVSEANKLIKELNNLHSNPLGATTYVITNLVFFFLFLPTAELSIITIIHWIILFFFFWKFPKLNISTYNICVIFVAMISRVWIEEKWSEQKWNGRRSNISLFPILKWGKLEVSSS